jgi:hypothetical protein
VAYLATRTTATDYCAPAVRDTVDHVRLMIIEASVLVAIVVLNRHRGSAKFRLLSPASRATEAVLVDAVRSRRPGKSAAVAIPLIVCAYVLWRAGEQVFCGTGRSGWAGLGTTHYLTSMLNEYAVLLGVFLAASAALNLALAWPDARNHQPQTSGKLGA